jgi:hypothetical protein
VTDETSQFTFLKHAALLSVSLLACDLFSRDRLLTFLAVDPDVDMAHIPPHYFSRQRRKR